jgi:hypothetical protein
LFRFHHAGDSDAEEADSDDEDDVPVDDSETEDRDREEQKRKNYDLLLRRRNTRKAARDRKKGTDGDSDVEEMLFEQVDSKSGLFLVRNLLALRDHLFPIPSQVHPEMRVMYTTYSQKQG